MCVFGRWFGCRLSSTRNIIKVREIWFDPQRSFCLRLRSSRFWGKKSLSFKIFFSCISEAVGKLNLMEIPTSICVAGPSHRVSVQGLQAQRGVVLGQTGSSEGGHGQTGTPVRDKVKGNISYKGTEPLPIWDVCNRWSWCPPVNYFAAWTSSTFLINFLLMND